LRASAATAAKDPTMPNRIRPGVQTLEGRYEFLPNPCTTRPCLPGMAYALKAGDAVLFVTSGGRWFAEARSWGGYTPQPGDGVVVTGEVREQLDADGQTFLVIEATSIAPRR
jgi:hypothetical protein